MEGFMLTINDAMEFFEICQKIKADTASERTMLLREFVAAKKAKYIRDPKQFFKGKNIVSIKRGNK